MQNSNGVTKTYTSEYLKNQDVKTMAKQGWIVSVYIRYPSGSFEVTYMKR